MNWFISNNAKQFSDFKVEYRTKNFSISSDGEFLKRLSDNLLIGIDGYIVPRYAVFEKYAGLDQYELLEELIHKFDMDFIHHIKGIFTIVLVRAEKVYLYVDRHSLKKYFTYYRDDVYLATNSLKLLSENYNLSIDYENVALFALFSHYFDGQTMFNDVIASKPGQYSSFCKNGLSYEFYWKPSLIIKNRKPRKFDINYYSGYWFNLIDYYFSYLRPKGVSFTLTGGNDSRMVLAALLKKQVKFDAFTFGDPLSIDNVTAKLISDKCNFNHSNYFIPNVTDAWFREASLKILGYGNSLINVHRAHRHDAIAEEVKTNSINDCLFTGLLGGEYIKEPNHRLLIPDLFIKILFAKSEKHALTIIENKLHSLGLNANFIDLNKVYNRITNFLDYGSGNSYVEKKFIYSYLFYGCSHHLQDTLVFNHHMKYVINPFMDVDFLELVSSYENWYINKPNALFSRLFHSFFQTAITDNLAPELSMIPYAKMGRYTANDILNQKSIYVLKRLKSIFPARRQAYPSSFPMGEWLYDFCKSELDEFHFDLTGLFDKAFLLTKLEMIKLHKSEENWHIVTNPINVSMNLKAYE
jgi:hypothetical protein